MSSVQTAMTAMTKPMSTRRLGGGTRAPGHLRRQTPGQG
jgi:hypothetical protein